MIEQRWTPYELGIILHYYTRPVDHDHAPIFDSTVERLIDIGLLKRTGISDPKYAITECGQAFVMMGLTRTPVPVQRWTMPDAGGGR